MFIRRQREGLREFRRCASNRGKARASHGSSDLIFAVKGDNKTAGMRAEILELERGSSLPKHRTEYETHYSAKSPCREHLQALGLHLEPAAPCKVATHRQGICG